MDGKLNTRRYTAVTVHVWRGEKTWGNRASSGILTMMSASDQGLKPDPDQAAAQQFLTELRTRISTQPLPYQYGVEARALESMWEVFAQARDAIKKNPGCENFANCATEVLNLVVRPLTAT